MAQTGIDYPPLFCEADKASASSQRLWFRLLFTQLALLLGTSIVGSVAWSSGPASKTSAVITGVFLATALVLSGVARLRQYNKAWFDCRAVAETVKSVAWSYMMAVPPYDSNDDSFVDSEFVANLNRARRARPGIEGWLALLPYASDPIPNSMRRIRQLPLSDRMEFYLRERLRDQVEWYTKRAHLNKRAESRCFWGALGIQLLALLLCFVQAASISHGANPVPAVVTLATAVIAWSQTRHHEDLTKSYSLTVQELHSLEALARHVQTPSDIQSFVKRVEYAISKEHMLWQALRRVGPIYPKEWGVP